LEIVRRNFSLKLLAVVLAVLGWAYFRVAGNSGFGSVQSAQLSVPIATVNLPLGNVAHYTEREAVVTVESKRGEPALKPEDIKAVLDLSNKEPGVYTIPVSLVAPEVVVQSLSPASVTLTIEKVEERSFPIAVHYVGSQPAGIVASNGVVIPSAALVRGPTSLLAQISAMQVDIAMPSAPKAVDEMVRPIPVDSSGAELTGLSVAPNLVRVETHFVVGSGPSK
jgi:YbbR domain-containing protein